MSWKKYAIEAIVGVGVFGSALSLAWYFTSPDIDTPYLSQEKGASVSLMTPVDYNPDDCKIAREKGLLNHLWACSAGGINFSNSEAIAITRDNAYEIIPEAFGNISQSFTPATTGLMFVNSHRVLYPVSLETGEGAYLLLDRLQLDPMGIFIRRGDIPSRENFIKAGYGSGYLPARLNIKSEVFVGFVNNALPESERPVIMKDNK